MKRLNERTKPAKISETICRVKLEGEEQYLESMKKIRESIIATRVEAEKLNAVLKRSI